MRSAVIKMMKINEHVQPEATLPTTTITTTTTTQKSIKPVTLAHVLITFFLYSLAFTLVIPAFPSLLLQVTNGRADLASYYYGSASCVRYFLEFFSSPFLGNLSDSYGRKGILLMSLSIMTVELLVLASFPSVTALFAMSILSGMGNAAMAMGYACVTDIALRQINGQVTNNFGYFSAIFGFGFILGPLCGSYLISISLKLCFFVASGICLLSVLFTWFCLDETCVVLRSYDPSKSSPLSSLRVFFSNKDLRFLSIPYCLSNLCTGIYFIWVLYMTHRFDASIVQVGVFMSVSGICGVLIQGFAIPCLIPNIVSDERATLIGLALSATQLMAYGFCPALWSFYLVLVLLSPASMYGPALKALLAKNAGPHEQGALQGALGSLRTVTAGVGSLLFSAAFSLSISMERPKIAGLPFFVASVMYVLSYIHTKSFLKHHGTSKDETERNNQTTSLLDATNHRLNNVTNIFFGNNPTRTTEESLNLLNSSHGNSGTNETITQMDRNNNNVGTSTTLPLSPYQARHPYDNDVLAITTSPLLSLSPHKHEQLVPDSFHQIGLSIPVNTEASEDPSFGYSALSEGETVVRIIHA